ncbi:MAG: SDR family NAD(P)-dependent oxidoreductase [Aureispira sp.]|nr:SDR family NAD(P)-dependent oxidoreductase [Aureispira sp.]
MKSPTHSKQKNNIVIVARRLEKLKEIQAQVEAKGSTCLSIVADALDASRAEEVVTEVVTAFGAVDIGVMVVGGGYPTITEELKVEEVCYYMDYNYNTLINYFVPLVAQMRKQGSGHIAHINSLAGFVVAPFMAQYGGTKAACRMFMDAAREELKQYNISITSLCPGFIDTPAMEKVKDKPTPFMMKADYAARKMIKALERKKRTYKFPFPLMFATTLTQWLPYRLRSFIFQQILKKN